MSEIEDLKVLISSDSGHPDFPKLGRLLFESGDENAAIGVLLAGLSQNPGAHEGRLLLAQIYFEKGYLPFAIREVQILQSELPQLESIGRLMHALDPEGKPEIPATRSTAQEETIAETDFDFEDMDLLSPGESDKN